jgi:hypothetical protein
VRIGTGKDAADVALATIFGEAQLENMQVYIDNLEEQSIDKQKRAISTTYCKP